MGWHPDWYRCVHCGAVYLEDHPRLCCWRAIFKGQRWDVIMTEDVFSIVGRDFDVKHPSD